MRRLLLAVLCGVLVCACGNRHNSEGGLPENDTPDVNIPAENDYTDNVFGVPLEMVYVEGGSFLMGTDADSENIFGDEIPQHIVTLDSFYISRFEISQEQWRAVMGRNPARFKADSLPVETVSWHDVMEFCGKLSLATGRKYTLPTEAQWEFAAKGGVKSRGKKYSGSDNVHNVAQMGKDVNYKGGCRGPNELGIYDMTGNVWEWCLDWYGKYPSDSVFNPEGEKKGMFRVIRGAANGSTEKTCRVTYRSALDPTSAGMGVGIRVVRN